MMHDILPVTSAMTRVVKMAAALVSIDAKVSCVCLFHKRFDFTLTDMTQFNPFSFVLLAVSVPCDVI